MKPHPTDESHGMTPYEIQSMREPLELAELLLRASEGVDVALGLALGGGWGAAAALRTEAKCDPLVVWLYGVYTLSS